MTSTSRLLSQLDDISIASTANRAQQLLLCCQEIKEEETQARRVAAAQLSRFNLWTSNIGVFSSRHSSLDYRLRTAPTAKVAVDGNIEMLCKYLLYVLAGCADLADEQLDAFAETSLPSVFDFGLELLEGSPSDEDARLSSLKSVEKTIDTLHRLSLAIRKASNRHSIARTPRLIGSDDGYTVAKTAQEILSGSGTRIEPVEYEATQSFEDFLSRALKSRWLASSSIAELNDSQERYREAMVRRCITAISVRRQQLTYFQSHQVKLSKFSVTGKGHPVQPTATSKVLEIHQQSDSLQVEHSFPTIMNQSTQQRLAGAVASVPLSETVPSEFNIASYRPSPSTAAPSSTASASNVGGLATSGPFSVPPAPEIKTGEKEKMCPYCCLVLPAKDFSTQKRSRRWRKHLLDDMQPYICLFSNCDQAGRTYRTFAEWQNHLNRPHVQHWTCTLTHSDENAIDERGVVFDTREHFRDHVNLYHSELDEPGANHLIYAAGQPAELPKWCFVCLTEQSSGLTLQKHLSRHLELAFILSLPARDDIEDTDVASSGRELSESTETDTAQCREMDIANLSDMYEEDVNITKCADRQSLTADEFTARLAEVSKDATQPQSLMLQTWTDQQRSISRGTVKPMIRKRWRTLIIVLRFINFLRLGLLDKILSLDSPFDYRNRGKWGVRANFLRAAMNFKLLLCPVEGDSNLEFQKIWGSQVAEDPIDHNLDPSKDPCDRTSRMYFQDTIQLIFAYNEDKSLIPLMRQACACIQAQKWQEADSLEDRIYQKRIESLGENHRATIMSLGNKATLCACQGKWEEVHILVEEVVERRRKEFGNARPRRFDYYTRLRVKTAVGGI